MTALYPRILGESFDRLPPAVRELHASAERRRYRGTGSVQRGSHAIARLIATLVGLPQAGREVAVTVMFTPDAKREIWMRTFGASRFRSVQWAEGALLAERLRLVTFRFHLAAEADGLSLETRSLHVLGIPIHRLFRPDIVARETERDGAFHFYVRARLPIIGLLVQYEGDLRKEE